MPSDYHALIVDDDPSTVLIYQQVLTPLGFTVTTASNGADALDLLRRQFYHLAIIDLLLPQVSGRDLVDYIHQAPHLRNTRLIVASAHSRFRDTVALDESDTFFVKPVTPGHLREVANQIVATASA